MSLQPAWIFHWTEKRNLSVEILASLEARHAEVEKVRRLVTLAREAEGWFSWANGTFSKSYVHSQGILFGHLEFNSGNVRWICNIPGTDRVITEEVTCFKFYSLLLWLLFPWVFTSLYIHCHDILSWYSPYIYIYMLHFCGWFSSYNICQSTWNMLLHRWSMLRLVGESLGCRYWSWQAKHLVCEVSLGWADAEHAAENVDRMVLN